MTQLVSSSSPIFQSHSSQGQEINSVNLTIDTIDAHNEIIPNLASISASPNLSNIDHKDENGKTSLHRACDNNDLTEVKKLLKAGANPNVKDNFGMTPLLTVVINYRKSIQFKTEMSNPHALIKLLLKYKANPEETGPAKFYSGEIQEIDFGMQDMCAFDHALKLQDFQLTKDILENFPNVQPTSEGLSSISMMPAEKEYIQLLIDNHSSFPLEFGDTNIFIEAARYVNKSLFRSFAEINKELLIKYVNNGNKEDPTTTPLKIFVDMSDTTDMSNIDIINFLIENGADITSLKSILFEENLYRKSKFYEWLFSNLPNINITDDNGNTPLHFITLKSDWSPHEFKYFELLCTFNPDCFRKNSNNQSAVDIALEKGNYKAIQIFSRHPEASKKLPKLHRSCKENRLEDIEPTRNTVYEKDIFGKTPLHYAIENNNVELFLILLKYVDIHNLPNWGPKKIPLCHFAAEKGSLEILKILHHQGIDVNQSPEYVPKSFNYQNSFEVAIENGQKDVCDWFIENYGMKRRFWAVPNFYLENLSSNFDLRYFINCIAAQHEKDENQEGLRALYEVGLRAAISSNQIDLALELFDKCDENIFISDHKKSILYLALVSKNANIVEKVILKAPSHTHLKLLSFLNTRSNPFQNTQEDTIPSPFIFLKTPVDNEVIDVFLNFVFKTLETTSSDVYKKKLLLESLESGQLDLFKKVYENPLVEDIRDISYIRSSPINMSPFEFAIQKGFIDIVKYLLSFSEQIIIRNRSTLGSDRALYYASLSYNEQMLDLIFQEYAKRKLKFDQVDFLTDLMYVDKTFSENLKFVVKYLIKKKICDFSEESYREIEKRLFSQKLLPSEDFNPLTAVLVYCLKKCNTINDFTSQLDDLDNFIQKVLSKKLYLTRYSANQTIHWMIEQIYLHIFLGSNPELASEPFILSKIADCISTLPKSDYINYLFVALQVCSDMDLIKMAVECACFKDKTNLVIPHILFQISFEQIQKIEKLLSNETLSYNEFKIQLASIIGKEPADDVAKFLKKREVKSILKEQESWLAYHAVYRSRSGTAAAYAICKRYLDNTCFVKLALKIFQAVGVDYKNKAALSKLSTMIQNIIRTTLSEDVKIEGIKALDAVKIFDSNWILFLEEELEKITSSSYTRYKLAIFSVLRNTKVQNDHEMSKIISLLMDDLKNPDEEIAFFAAYTLSTFADNKNLLEVLSVIKSRVWSRYDEYYGENKIDQIGGFLTFRSRPDFLHDNRNALIENIINRMTFRALQDPTFALEVDTRMQSATSIPELSQLRERFEGFQKNRSYHCRYAGFPVIYPKGTDLIRGLSTRKGDKSFQECIRDLIRKGSGSSSLADGSDAQVDTGTWKKIGHIFASHNANLYFDKGSTYFSAGTDGVVNESALVIVPAEYYHQEYVKGESRIEIEGSFNNVFYNGIPKQWIKAIYLPLSYKQDLELLACDEPIVSIKPKLSEPAFANGSIKELCELRRLLRAKEIDPISKNEIPFIKKFFYFGEVAPEEVGKLLVKDGMHFVDESAIVDESLRFMAARLLLKEKYEKEHGHNIFRCQDEILQLESDDEFVNAWDELMNMLPKDFLLVHMTDRKLDVIKRNFKRLVSNIALSTKVTKEERACIRLALLIHVVTMEKDHDQIKVLISLIQKNPTFYGITSEEISFLENQLLAQTI